METPAPSDQGYPDQLRDIAIGECFWCQGQLWMRARALGVGASRARSPCVRLATGEIDVLSLEQPVRASHHVVAAGSEHA